MKRLQGSKQKPFLIDINPFHLHLPALVSILHRLSGILVFFMIPLLLLGLQESLQSADHFDLLKSKITGPIAKISLWIAISALGYHWIAGIRHMLMDMHIGESKQGGRISSGIVLCLFILFAFGMGVTLW